MGLFEHDAYRNQYETYEAAMRNTYVSPYGEDPFDMMRMLMEEHDLAGVYPGLKDLRYSDMLDVPFALEYERRMLELVQGTQNG